MSHRETRNPFYPLLLIASLLFVINALAWAIVPAIEDNARALGQPLPRSELRELLRDHGGEWLLFEVAAMIVFGLLSMGLDRRRRLQKQRTERTIPPSDDASAQK
jgi:type II secretory pathway component PulF